MGITNDPGIGNGDELVEQQLYKHVRTKELARIVLLNVDFSGKDIMVYELAAVPGKRQATTQDWFKDNFAVFHGVGGS